MSQQVNQAAYTVDLDKLVDIIRDMSFARAVFPVSKPVPIEKKRGSYWQIGETDETQYNFDLVSPKYSRFDLIEKNPAIPIHQGNLGYTRHEVKRLNNSKLPVDQRQRLVLEQIVAKEESVAFGGHSDTSITSFADTTNNSTAFSSSLDLTSYATGVKTFELAYRQLKNLLKNKFQGSTVMMVWTTDVDSRAYSCLNSDETKTFGEWLESRIGKQNIIATDYLGSASGAGTTNATLVPKDPRNLELLSSALETVVGVTTLKGLEVELALRSRPVFYRGVKSCLYDASVDITP